VSGLAGAATALAPPVTERLGATFGTGIGGTRPVLGVAACGSVSRAAAGAIPGATLSCAPVPSKPKADTSPRPTVKIAAGMRRSDIRIGPDLPRATRVRDRAAQRRADLIGIFPQI